jgi:hypothetical protein
VSSYIRAVEMRQYPVGGFANTQVFSQEVTLPCFNLFPVEEAEKVHVCYFMKHEVLMRKWRPPDVTA